MLKPIHKIGVFLEDLKCQGIIFISFFLLGKRKILSSSESGMIALETRMSFLQIGMNSFHTEKNIYSTKMLLKYLLPMKGKFS